jgi:hypothetical protein
MAFTHNWSIGTLYRPYGLCQCRYTSSVNGASTIFGLVNMVIRVSNGSNPLEQFRVRVGTGTEPLQRVLPHENLDRCHWAGFTTKNPAFQVHIFGSN